MSDDGRIPYRQVQLPEGGIPASDLAEPPGGGGAGGGESRLLFRDDCLTADLPPSAVVVGSPSFDSTNKMRLFSDVAEGYSVGFPLTSIGMAVDLTFQRVSGWNQGGFEVSLRKGAQNLCRMTAQGDGNLVFYNASNGAAFNTGTGQAADRTIWRVRLFATRERTSGGAAMADGTSRWSSGWQGTPAGVLDTDTITLELNHTGANSTTGLLGVTVRRPGWY